MENIAERLEAVTKDLASVTDGLERAIKKNYDNILVSCSEAARHLGVTSTTLSRYIKEGRLDKITIGESTGIRFSQIIELKAQ